MGLVVECRVREAGRVGDFSVRVYVCGLLHVWESMRMKYVCLVLCYRVVVDWLYSGATVYEVVVVFVYLFFIFLKTMNSDTE